MMETRDGKALGAVTAGANRRVVVKQLIAGGVLSTSLPVWIKPVVESVVLPAHAQTTTSPATLVGAITWNTAAGSLGSDFTERSASFSVSASVDSGSITYALTSGTLPNGLSLDASTGQISGTPTGISDYDSVDFDFTITATSTQGATSDRQFQISIESRYVGFSCTTTAEGGIASDTAPSGLVFNRTDFSSYGTPTGSCGSFATSSCNSITSNSYTAAGSSSYTVGALNGTWGDPCFGTAKRLQIQMSFGAF